MSRLLSEFCSYQYSIFTAIVTSASSMIEAAGEIIKPRTTADTPAATEPASATYEEALID